MRKKKNDDELFDENIALAFDWDNPFFFFFVKQICISTNFQVWSKDLEQIGFELKLLSVNTWPYA